MEGAPEVVSRGSRRWFKGRTRPLEDGDKGYALLRTYHNASRGCVITNVPGLSKTVAAMSPKVTNTTEHTADAPQIVC